MYDFSKVQFYKIEDTSQRIDNFLLKLLKIPKSHIYSIIRRGEVKINNKKCKINQKLQVDDIVRIPPIQVKEYAEKQPPKNLIEFEILYEDSYYIVINKPSGIACHSGSGNNYGVIDYMKAKYKPYIELIHRIDKGTSGILMLAKKRSGLVAIHELLSNKMIQKEYLLLCAGIIKKDTTVRLPLYKKTYINGESRMRVDEKLGQYACTKFIPLQKFSNINLVQALPYTGKTHQIRIHAEAIGLSLIGDDKYGTNINNDVTTLIKSKRLCLHASGIYFTHPMTGEEVKIHCKLPLELKNIIATL